MVSVIIPTYKGSKYLARAINSVLGQEYADYEILVVDDNDPNTEGRALTEKLMEVYKDNKKVRYIKHPYNKNGSAARNTGINAATGEYLSFLDDDDFYLPKRLLNCVDEIKQRKTDAVYTSVLIIKRDLVCGFVEATKSGDLFQDLLIDENIFGTGSNLFIKRNVCCDIGMFNETLARHQDYEFLLRMFSRGYYVSCLQKCLVVKAMNETNNSVKYDKLKEVKAKLLEEFKTNILLLGPETKRRVYISQHKELLNAAFMEGNIKGINVEKSILKEQGYSYRFVDYIKEIIWRLDDKGKFQKIYWKTKEKLLRRSICKTNKIEYLFAIKYINQY